MGGHVVVAFEIVSIGRIAIRRPALHQRFQIVADRGIGILGNGQAATRMAAENMGNSGVDRSIPDDGSDFAGNFR